MLLAVLVLACMPVAEGQATATPSPVPPGTPTPASQPWPPRPQTVKALNLGGEETEVAPPARGRSLSDVAAGVHVSQPAGVPIVIVGRPKPPDPASFGALADAGAAASPDTSRRLAAKRALAGELAALAPRASEFNTTMRAYYDACQGKYTEKLTTEERAGVAAGADARAAAVAGTGPRGAAVAAGASYGEWGAAWVQRSVRSESLANETTVECRTLQSRAQSLLGELTTARDDAVRRARAAGTLPGDEREVLNGYGLNW